MSAIEKLAKQPNLKVEFKPFHIDVKPEGSPPLVKNVRCGYELQGVFELFTPAEYSEGKVVVTGKMIKQVTVFGKGDTYEQAQEAAAEQAVRFLGL